MTFEDAARLDKRIVREFNKRPDKKRSFSRWYRKFRSNQEWLERVLSRAN